MTDKKPKSGKITKEMPIDEVAFGHPETVEVFQKYGMHCLGCAAARFENLEQGCAAHGIDVDAMVKDLNVAIEKGGEKEAEKKAA